MKIHFVKSADASVAALRFILILALTLAGTIASAGNGSSGVGNAKPIMGDIEANLPPGFIAVRRGEISDGKTGEKILSVKPVSRTRMVSYGAQLKESVLGSTKGFEYIPDLADTNGENFWIACDKKTCFEMRPLSKTNTKVHATIGALRTFGSRQ